MGKSFLLKDRLLSVTLVGIYNYYGTWIIWAAPYEDWLPFMGCVWEQQRAPCCSNWCWHPQTGEHRCRSASVTSPGAVPESWSLPTLHSEQGSDLAWFNHWIYTNRRQEVGLKILKIKLWAVSHHSREKGAFHHIHVSIFRGETFMSAVASSQSETCRPIIRLLQGIGYCTPTVITW